MRGINLFVALLLGATTLSAAQEFDIPRVQPLTKEQKVRRQQKQFRVSPYSARRPIAPSDEGESTRLQRSGEGDETEEEQQSPLNILPDYYATGSTKQIQRFQRLDSAASDAVPRGFEDSPFPVFLTLPPIKFSCENRLPGFYADKSAGCQVYHQCLYDGRRYTHLCGVGTVFNQVNLVCDHWYNYDCNNADTDAQVNEKYQKFFTTQKPTPRAG